MASASDRFAFGRNWSRFARRNLTPERAQVAQRHLMEFLEMDTLAGKTFLDIGCGSGVHSLGALNSGAQRVVSFDYDPDSVATTIRLKLEAGNPSHWTVMHGDVLDDAFMASLAPADVVYSWGGAAPHRADVEGHGQRCRQAQAGWHRVHRAL